MMLFGKIWEDNDVKLVAKKMTKMKKRKIVDCFFKKKPPKTNFTWAWLFINKKSFLTQCNWNQNKRTFIEILKRLWSRIRFVLSSASSCQSAINVAHPITKSSVPSPSVAISSLAWSWRFSNPSFAILQQHNGRWFWCTMQPTNISIPRRIHHHQGFC